MPTRILLSLISFLIFFFLSINPTYAASIVKSASVDGNKPWKDTGVDVPVESLVEIKYLSGVIYPANFTIPPVTPTGQEGCIAGPTFVLPEATCYSLIGRLGNGPAFSIPMSRDFFGILWGKFIATSTDRLNLGFNDDVNYFSDNLGGWSLTVFVHTPTPTPTLTPTPTPTLTPSKTPLILIPGIGGSELKTANTVNWSSTDDHGGVFTHTYPAGEKVWVNEGEAIKPGNDDYFDVLRMYPDGVFSQASLETTGNLYSGAYQEAINFFTSNGYALNTDLFVFPYDWRKDNVESANLLNQKIESIKAQTGATKVDIVAHSMGGLIARYYISDPQKAQNVRKLFTLGSPHLGSTKFLKALRYGNCFAFELGSACLSLAPSEMKDVIQNMISGFELAPSQTYFNFYSGEDNQHPYPYRTETGALNYTQIKSLLTTLGHNTSLFDLSESFHAIDTNFSNTNGVDITIIAGSGKATLGQIIEEKTTSLTGVQNTQKDFFSINGDGTVPLFSASLNDTDKNQSLLGSAKLFYTNQEHGNLVANGAALNLVKNILLGDATIPNGISANPYKFSGQQLSVHSPVNINAYDAAGNHTGPTADGFEANIPGSSYETLDDAKFVFLPENGQYNIKFEATDQGSFDFKIREFEGDVISETVLYDDIPLATSTKAEATFDSTSPQPPVLQIDVDGNGTTDKAVTASVTLTGDQNYDETPPTTTVTLTGTKGQNNWFTHNIKVEINAMDEANGSGVRKIEYTLNDSSALQTYTQAFIISTEGTTKLKVSSTDNAGNVETSQEFEIKIDKVPPEAKIFVDQDKQDLVVESVDANPVAVTRQDNTETKKKDDAFYIITDGAGNTLKLDVRERDREKQDRFRIYSLQYNDSSPVVLENNHFNVKYQGKKDKLNVKEQSFEVKDEIKIRIQYNAKKNQSTIVEKESKGERIKETVDGLLLLKLVTNAGQLQPQY